MRKVEKKVLKNLIKLDEIIIALGYLAEKLREEEIKKELPEEEIGESVPDSTLLFWANEELGNSKTLDYLTEFIERQDKKKAKNRKIRGFVAQNPELQGNF